MVMLDANVILRYLLNDNEDMAAQAEEIIRKNRPMVTFEVMAEVVYVLSGVYSVDRTAIADSLIRFLDEVEMKEPEVLREGLRTYGTTRLDFVDCILYGYRKVRSYEVATFDRKLKRLLTSVEEPDEIK